MIEIGDPEWRYILESFQTYGQRQFNKAEFRPILEELIISGALPGELESKVQQLWDQLPETASLNQILFFAIYNEVLTPRIRAHTLQLEQTQRRPFGLLELRQVVGEALLEQSASTKALLQSIIQAL